MKYGKKANLSSESCSDISELEDNERNCSESKKLLERKKNGSKYEKLPKRCRPATCGKLQVFVPLSMKYDIYLFYAMLHTYTLYK